MMTLGTTLEKLYAIILERKASSHESTSYVASLFAKGTNKIAQKVGEEAIEVVIARENPAELVKESADLLFHLSVLWAQAGIVPSDVAAELQKREGISGLEEKASRKVGDHPIA
jgi:phosphoribosyl-ATP pyrophosphohydrolase